MMKSPQDPNISSAEMTAYWRSLFPQFSHDKASIRLATVEGIQKAKEFEKKFDYPLIGRKVSVRAGFILDNAVRLLSTGKYDSCISFASGFSLLNYYIAEKLGSFSKKIHFIDSDLSHMSSERKRRIASLPSGILAHEIEKDIKIMDIDLESACKSGRSFKDLFPECKKPLFIIEGVIYFLSQECVKWMMANINTYFDVALIFDYWPEDGVLHSACFKRVVDSLKGFIPENIKSFWDERAIMSLKTGFQIFEDHKISDIEHEMSVKNHEQAQFKNPNEFFPVKFVVAEKNL